MTKKDPGGKFATSLLQRLCKKLQNSYYYANVQCSIAKSGYLGSLQFASIKILKLYHVFIHVNNFHSSSAKSFSRMIIEYARELFFHETSQIAECCSA